MSNMLGSCALANPDMVSNSCARRGGTNPKVRVNGSRPGNGPAGDERARRHNAGRAQRRKAFARDLFEVRAPSLPPSGLSSRAPRSPKAPALLWYNAVAQATIRAPRATSTSAATGCKPNHTSRGAPTELRSSAVATAIHMRRRRGANGVAELCGDNRDPHAKALQVVGEGASQKASGRILYMQPAVRRPTSSCAAAALLKTQACQRSGNFRRSLQPCLTHTHT